MNRPVAIAEPSSLKVQVAPAAWRWLMFPAGAGLLLVLVCVSYFPALNGQFIWDDHLLVANNKLVHASDGLFRIWFTTEPFDYWPITNTTFWMEWRLWGADPTGYHVVNLLLHTASAIFLWRVLASLSIAGAYLAALLFAVHPVNVESVAWIAQGKNTLAMLFFLLSILWYLRQESARGGKEEAAAFGFGRWYCCSLLAFLLAMLSKGSVAVLPPVLLLIAWWKRRRIGLTDLWRTAPFFVVAAVLTGVNIYFQTHGGDPIRAASAGARISGAGAVPWFYLSKALAPIDLMFVYPQWRVEVGNFQWWLPTMGVVVVTAALAWCGGRRQSPWARALLFAWLFFCLALLPVLGITDVYFMKFALVADHYQYIALIGVAALMAAGWSRIREAANPTIRSGALIGAIAIVGSLVGLARQQSALYTNATTLYEATLVNNPSCWLARVNLGQEFLDAGRRAEAIAEFFKAAQLKPDLPEAHNNLGHALLDSGSLQPAIEHLEEALRLKPNYADAHDNLGNALVVAGRLREAHSHFQRAIELKPDVPEFYNDAAIELALNGRWEQAIEYFQRAVQLRPNYPDAHKNLSLALLRADRPDQAVDHYLRALQLKPDDASTYAAVLNVYPALNRPDDAIATAQKALQVARAAGQAALAEKVEAWLNNYRSQQADSQNSANPDSAGSEK